MQPDNIRPAARIPNITFSDDIVHFQSKVLRSRRQSCALNATIPLIPLSAKTGNYSSACTPVRRCGRLAVAFMPQVLRLLVDFRAGLALPPDHGHACAAHRHKCGSPVNARVMKRLPESGLVRLVSQSVFEVEVVPVRVRKRVKTRDCRPVPELPMLSVYAPSEIRLKKARRRRSGGIAGKRGLDRSGEADDGGGPGGGAAGRDRGADPGGHAGDRDFQPALYRERRALHDGDVDVPFRHRYAEDHGGHFHPRRSSAGDGALRCAEAVCAGREQAGAVMHCRAYQAKWC